MKRIAVLLFLLCSSWSATAGLSDAEDAYRHGKYAEALKEYTRLAEAGFKNAHFMLAMMYANGQGVARDEAKVIEHGTIAANNGELAGISLIAAVYSAKHSTFRDKEKALYWLNRGVELKDTNSMRMLSRQYRVGDLVEKDLPKAFSLMKDAYDREDSLAVVELGEMYEDGIGVAPDPDKARALYQRAVTGRAQPETHYRLATLLEKRNASSANLYKAFHHYQVAARGGNVPAMLAMGRMYENGLAVPVDYLQAAVWYERAANHGNAQALFNGGRLFEKGLGAKQNTQEAFNWFSEGAALKHGASIRRIGRYADEGRLQPADHGSAALEYCKATFAEAKQWGPLLLKKDRSAAETDTVIAHGAILESCPALPAEQQGTRQKMMASINTALDSGARARMQQLAAAMKTKGNVTAPLLAFIKLDGD